LAEVFGQELRLQRGEVSNLPNPIAVQLRLGDLPNPRDLTLPCGLAWSEQILATSREVAAPVELFNPVSALMALCSLCAASIGGPCSRSVPVMSR
jgi:hypothetical protein